MRYNTSVKLKRYLITGFIAALLFLAGFFTSQWFSFESRDQLLSPFTTQEKKHPLLQYTIANLAKRRYQPSEITIEETIEETADFNSYLFSYTSMDKKITGQLNIPNGITDPTPVILMIRGYVPQETYTTGTGTSNAAAYLARNGYITIAPDFLGYGKSDAEAEDVWEARFIKPINVIELINSLTANPKISTSLLGEQTAIIDPTKLGIWAHSNGGQIAITVLEILGENIPTTLWAPVTSPFPYSVLYYSDENEDEGRDARAWVAQFEEEYDSREFSLTQHLTRLTGPIQLHHGSADEAAPQVWSDEFNNKISVENQRRSKETEAGLPEIELTYYQYPGADHNLQPVWNTVVQRDLSFFNSYLRE